jgi:hypothetical protein
VSGGSRGQHDDDELIQALADRQPVDGDPLAGALAAWTADLDRGLPPVRPPPVPPPVVPGPSGGRLLRPTVAAAVMVGLVVASGAVVVHSAQPGGTFWDLSRRVDPGRAASLEARQHAAQCLAEAEHDLAAGRVDQAREQVAIARTALALVRDGDGRTALSVRAAVLAGQLSGQHTGQAARPSPSPSPSSRVSPVGTRTVAPTRSAAPAAPATVPTGTATPTPAPDNEARQPVRLRYQGR